MAAAALATALSGCFTPPPARDPLAGMNFSAVDPRFKNMTVGLR